MRVESKRRSLPEIQLVRAIAIIGVLSVHATSFATVAMKDSNFYVVYNFFNIFMRIGTPVFMFLSSFVLFYSYYARPFNAKLFSNFYKKRLKYILVPYVLFSLLYFLMVQLTNQGDLSLREMIESFVVKLFTGKAYTHLYFIFISVQFYIIFPLLLWLFKCKPSLAKWAVPAGFVMQYAFVILNHTYSFTGRPASVVLYYMSYLMLGAVLGMNYSRLRVWFDLTRDNITSARLICWIGLWMIWLSAALGHVYVYHTARLYGAEYDSLLYHTLWNIQTITVGLLCIQISIAILRYARPWLTRWMTRLGELSFGIYLIHPLFLFIYRRFPPETGYSPLVHLWYLGGFVLALAASFLVVSFTARWLPQSWIIFGKIAPSKRERGTS
ncbi:acyltransferase [Paenibacillus dakarensis]|uniref:acyltransferase n=1 Tax=Paenibacillus dakarensis TaxID=1527293 RepID=UPI0006D59348|nr:acyltransferase [Paenibacillus dakarensis]